MKNRINANYSTLPEKNETNSKAPKFKVNDRAIINKYKNVFVKFALKIGEENYLLLISFWIVILEQKLK